MRRQIIPLRLLVLAILGVVAFGSAALNAAPEARAGIALQKSACPFDTRAARLPVECGRLKVPENYDASAKAIEIAFMIAYPRGKHDLSNPVLYLSGGPGSPTLAYAERLVVSPLVHNVVVDRPWVFFDQRGQGRSVPALRCPREEDYFKRLKLCRDALIKDGVDLSQYNSVRSARDIEELRKALGVGQWNLWSVSYGSRLAFAVARDFPASIRAIVHDGPSYVEGLEIVDDFRGADIALNRLLMKCATDAVCQSRYPDLRERFLTSLPRLRERPISVGEERFDDARVVTFVRDALFAGTQVFDRRVSQAPAYMDAAAKGDGEAMLRIEKAAPQETDPFADNPIPAEGRYAMGQNLSVECFDERGFESPDDYRLAAEQSDIVRALFGKAMLASAFQECAVWPSGRADRDRKSRVYFDGPQLAFTGDLDPTLSGLSGYEMEMLFPNARNVVFRNAGHAQAPLDVNPLKAADPYMLCALRLGRRFFADPHGELDTRCAKTRALRLAQ